jgi:hypothetical protein
MPRIAEAKKTEVATALGLATQSASAGATILILPRTVWWRVPEMRKKSGLAGPLPLIFENLNQPPV